jgi:hypothetical protein
MPTSAGSKSSCSSRLCRPSFFSSSLSAAFALPGFALRGTSGGATSSTFAVVTWVFQSKSSLDGSSGEALISVFRW